MILMRLRRSLPAMLASTGWPASSSTVNIPARNFSTTFPITSIASSFGKLFSSPFVSCGHDELPSKCCPCRPAHQRCPARTLHSFLLNLQSSEPSMIGQRGDKPNDEKRCTHEG